MLSHNIFCAFGMHIIAIGILPPLTLCDLLFYLNIVNYL